MDEGDAFENIDEEAFNQLIEEVLGSEVDIDPSMIEEFRSSEHYEDFIRTAACRRRPSVDLSEPGQTERSENKDDERESSTSSSNKKEQTKTQVSKSKKDKNESKRGRIQNEEASFNSKAAPIPARTRIDTFTGLCSPPSSSSSERSSIQETVVKNRLRLKLPAPTAKKKEKKGDSSKINKNVKASPSTPSKPQSKQESVSGVVKECATVLHDLKEITSVFPYGVRSPVAITARMLDMIYNIEREVRATYANQNAKSSSSTSGRLPAQKMKKSSQNVPETFQIPSEKFSKIQARHSPSPEKMESRKSPVDYLTIPVSKMSKARTQDKPHSKTEKGRHHLSTKDTVEKAEEKSKVSKDVSKSRSGMDSETKSKNVGAKVEPEERTKPQKDRKGNKLAEKKSAMDRLKEKSEIPVLVIDESDEEENKLKVSTNTRETDEHSLGSKEDFGFDVSKKSEKKKKSKKRIEDSDPDDIECVSGNEAARKTSNVRKTSNKATKLAEAAVTEETLEKNKEDKKSTTESAKKNKESSKSNEVTNVAGVTVEKEAAKGDEEDSKTKKEAAKGDKVDTKSCTRTKGTDATVTTDEVEENIEDVKSKEGTKVTDATIAKVVCEEKSEKCSEIVIDEEKHVEQEIRSDEHVPVQINAEVLIETNLIDKKSPLVLDNKSKSNVIPESVQLINTDVAVTVESDLQADKEKVLDSNLVSPSDVVHSLHAEEVTGALVDPVKLSSKNEETDENERRGQECDLRPTLEEENKVPQDLPTSKTDDNDTPLLAEVHEVTNVEDDPLSPKMLLTMEPLPPESVVDERKKRLPDPDSEAVNADLPHQSLEELPLPKDRDSTELEEPPELNEQFPALVIEEQNDQHEPSPQSSGNIDDDLPAPDSSSSPVDIIDTTKSLSPERMVPKKKNVVRIESSSDDNDGDLQKDPCDDTDTTMELRKSSDEEPVSKKTVTFERKRDDSRYGKFDKFEHERRRKMSDKKKEKEKPKENDPLEDVLKEKPLAGSFRIPKKTSHVNRKSRHDKLEVATPLAAADVPKENLQFEKFRKVSEKKDRDHYDSRGPGQRHERLKDEPGPGSYYRYKNRLMGEEGPPTLAPKLNEKMPTNADVQETGGQEPLFWGDERDGSGGFGSTSEEKSLDGVQVKTDKKEIKEDSQTAEAEDKESKKVVNDVALDPEVPVTEVPVNQLAIAMLTVMDGGVEFIQLPNVDSVNNLYEATVMKLAWWFIRANFDNASAVNECDSDIDDGASDSSFLERLEWSDSEEDFDFRNHQRAWVPADEYYGRSLLTAEYRSGPDDKFSKIFQLRSGGSYEKEKFQANCNLCKVFVVGRNQLADHVLSKEHTIKMATCGGVDLPVDDVIKPRNAKENEPTKVERDKKQAEADKIAKNGKESHVERKSEDKEKKEDKDRKEEKKVEEGRSSEKRKRSKERTEDKSRRSDEIGTTSTGLSLKIPAGAIPDRNNSTSRPQRSKSRSPRRDKRARSRSPHHRRRSKSRSPRSRRRRSREPILRIPRSPTGLREQPRRRSTSAERVEKFLAKTNRRNRSRSPINSHSHKRHRRSRSKSPVDLLPSRNNREFREKLALQAQGKWTDDMEQRWKLMEMEVAVFMEQYGEKRKSLLDVPENHPSYSEEWSAFWERRFQEVEQQGLDAETYNYVPEWKEYWSKKLRELLDIACETGSLEIKKKFGMDLDTLQKLNVVEPEPIVVPTPVPPPDPILLTNTVPPSVHNPVLIPNPIPVPAPVSNSAMNRESSSSTTSMSNADNTPLRQTSLSVTSGRSLSMGEDFTARSMSISDGGSVTMEPTVSKPGAPPSQITANDIISQWEKLKSGGASRPTVTPNTTTIAALPRSVKSVGGASNTDSQSIESVEFNGFDLVQILRVMSVDLEFELSFFSSQVKDYFQRAEALDLKKRNKSLELLNEEDFVVMLFNIRDRFMTMIRSNVLSRDALNKVNLTVFSLTSLFEHPSCQKHRVKIASAASALQEVDKQEVMSTSSDGKSNSASDSKLSSRNVAKGKVLSKEKKEKIAKLLTGFIMTMGRNRISDEELRELVHKFVPLESIPSVNKNVTMHTNPLATASRNNGNPKTTEERRVPGEVTKTFSIASAHGVGSAVPSLPNIDVPLFHRNMTERQHEQDAWGRGHTSSSESASGRHSPFSRRNYSGNPASNPLRDKDLVQISSNNEGGIENLRTFHHNMYQTEVHGGFTVRSSCRSGDSVEEARDTLNSLTMRRDRKTCDIVGNDIESREHSEQRSSQSQTHSNKPNLPPGIMQFVMMERFALATQPGRRIETPESPEIINLSDDPLPKKVETKKARKKRKRYRSRDTSTSSSDSEDERRYRKERKKYRRKSRKKHRREGRRKKSREFSVDLIRRSSKNRYGRRAPPENSNESNEEMENYAPEPRKARERQVDNSRVSEDYYHKNSRWNASSTYIPPPTHSIASSSRSIKIVIPGQNYVESDWENDGSNSKEPLQRQQSAGELNRTICSGGLKDISGSDLEAISGTSNSNNEKKPPSKAGESERATKTEKTKVTSVSETFWTSKDDDKSLSSISSNEGNTKNEKDTVVAAPIERNLRGSKDESKESGEVSSSD